MKKFKFKNNYTQGFTIIEVVLVLAIAGLIFLMVFVALPALQRNQRDTQRKNDMARLKTAIESYKANNRGQLPWTYGVQGS
jgi:prepilin-type N-terminal cleavage/methylation domain-containing protein